MERGAHSSLRSSFCEEKGAIPMMQTTRLDLYAGIPVADFAAAVSWYERLLGTPPTSRPYDTEAVWELAEHRYLFVWQQSENVGHASHLLFVDGLDALVGEIADRGLDPSKRETYSNGVRRIAYRDPDGNEIAFCGDPA
jgi:catechol 2,3-dioxygenase-like lactoylglutathione lyase family enzyme